MPPAVTAAANFLTRFELRHTNYAASAERSFREAKRYGCRRTRVPP